MKNERVNLLDAVCREAKKSKSKFRNDQPGRNALRQFLEANRWFGMEHGGTDQDMWISSMEPLERTLGLWLRAYGRSGEEKIELLLETYAASLPRTCRMFRDYMLTDNRRSATSALNLLDFLLYYLDREIDEYDSKSLLELTVRANEELSVSSMRQLTEFLRSSVSEVWAYQFHGRRQVKPENAAYTQEQFGAMAYVIFNEASWKDNDLLRKAAGKRKYAEFWLFTALHFVCAIRKSDIFRLPPPSLPYSSEELRGRILRGTFESQKARSVSEELMFRMKMKAVKPGKTERYDPPCLKLFIPESLLEPMGVILSLSLSYRRPEDPFMRENRMSTRETREFFGEKFIKALGYREFSSRRANKAYLQGIEMMENGSGKPKGYMLAALARSHKGGIGGLPKATDVYLRDAHFSGCSPDFILREMFERGIFGFIPVLLLQNYAGEEFKKLSVTGQTKLIKALGMDATQLESLTASVMKSFRQAEEIVRALLRERCGEPNQLEAVLRNVASGAAPSRQSELLCLRAAAECACCEPDRAGCVGCRYEIYTKSAMHLLMKEYSRLNKEKERSDDFHKRRLGQILEKAVLPAVAEILASVPLLYPGADMETFYELMERGVKNADCASD